MNRRTKLVVSIGCFSVLLMFLFPRWFAWHNRYKTDRELFPQVQNDVGQLNRDAIDVSIIRLIAAPSDCAGKAVRVVGFLHLEFEGNGIYLHREDYDNGIIDNSLWVDAPQEMMNKMMKMNDHYVLLEGVFAPEDHGHLGLSSGAIVKVNRVVVWPPFLRGKK